MCFVAPRAGAWIEAALLVLARWINHVAPLAGATYVDLYYHGHSPDISQALKHVVLFIYFLVLKMSCVKYITYFSGLL